MPYIPIIFWSEESMLDIDNNEPRLLNYKGSYHPYDNREDAVLYANLVILNHSDPYYDDDDDYIGPDIITDENRESITSHVNKFIEEFEGCFTKRDDGFIFHCDFSNYYIIKIPLIED